MTSKDFHDLASHSTVRQTLWRLTRQGTICRLLRGVYHYPEHSDLRGGPARPDPDAVAQAIARAHGWTLIPAGQTALKLLGLSRQAPTDWLYFSDGPSKQYVWDGVALVLKHRANKETSILSPRTALVVQALKTLGQDRVDETVLATLRAHLQPKERARALREARYVTAWVYEHLKRLAAEERPVYA